MPLEGVNHIHRSDCFAFGMLAVGYSISDNVLEENLEERKKDQQFKNPNYPNLYIQTFNLTWKEKQIITGRRKYSLTPEW